MSHGGRGLFRMPNRQAAVIGWKAAQARQAAERGKGRNRAQVPAGRKPAGRARDARDEGSPE